MPNEHDVAGDFQQVASQARDTVRLLKSEHEGRAVASHGEAAIQTSQQHDWARPTSLLNTRIPGELAEQLDDLIFRLKKQRRTRVTKQEITAEAIRDLLQKYSG